MAKQDTVNLQDMSAEELKSLWFDVFMEQQQLQRQYEAEMKVRGDNLSLIAQELQTRRNNEVDDNGKN